ncbi:MAG: hypothetical protein NT107_00050 [Planctomycetota bacterium]|nr:hypothetical protein [Planctomycetota bacterium]
MDPLPAAYRDRECAGRAWRRRFPDAPADKIRAFLDCLVDGMAFPRTARLKFRPEDPVRDIYKAIYGGRVPFGDHLECESFAGNLSDEFAADMDLVQRSWRAHVTLGELFEGVVLRRAG